MECVDLVRRLSKNIWSINLVWWQSSTNVQKRIEHRGSGRIWTSHGRIRFVVTLYGSRDCWSYHRFCAKFTSVKVISFCLDSRDWISFLGQCAIDNPELLPEHARSWGKKKRRPAIQMLFPHDATSATYTASLSDSEQLHAFIGTSV